LSLDPVIMQTMSWLLAGLFAFAARHKLAAREAFEVAVRGYALVPERAIPAFRIVLASAEIATAILLILPGSKFAGVCIAALLLFLYLCAMVSALLRNRANIDCGCHLGIQSGAGDAEAGITWVLVLRNAALIAIAGSLLLPLGRPVHWLDILGGVGAAFSIVLLLHSAETVRRNHRAIVASVRSSS